MFPDDAVYGIFVIIRGDQLSIADYGSKPGFAAQAEVPVGPVPKGPFTLGVYVNRTGQQAVVFVDNVKRDGVFPAKFPSDAKEVAFIYGVYATGSHSPTAVSYDDIRLVGK